MSKYIRKTRDRWDIETNWGYGWEVECSKYTAKEARERWKEYQQNAYSRFDLRIRKHRERIKQEPTP